MKQTTTKSIIDDVKLSEVHKSVAKIHKIAKSVNLNAKKKNSKSDDEIKKFHSDDVTITAYSGDQSQVSELINIVTAEGFKLESVQPYADGPFSRDNKTKLLQIIKGIISLISKNIPLFKRGNLLILLAEHEDCDRITIVTKKEADLALISEQASSKSKGLFSPNKANSPQFTENIVLFRQKDI